MKRLPRSVWALGVTSLFTDASSEMIFPLLPVFLVSIGGSAAFLGLVEGVADAISSVLKLVTGRLSDRLARSKPLVVFGYGLASLARPLAGIAVVPVHILAVRVVDRVGKGIRSSPRDALIAASVPATEAGRAFGLQRALDHAGAVIGPLVAAVLIKAGFEMREVFLLAAIPAGLAVLSLAFVREDAREPAPARKPSAAVPLSPRLRRYLAIVFLFSLGNSTDAFLLLRARSIGVSEAALPLLWAVLHVSKVLSAYVGGGAADRMARPRLIALGWVVYGLAYIGLGFASTEWHAFALFAFYGTYYGLTEPAEKALVGELAPEGGRGRAFGAYNFLVGVSAIPAGLLTGIIWQRVSPLAALSVGAAIAAVAMVLLLDWERRA